MLFFDSLLKGIMYARNNFSHVANIKLIFSYTLCGDKSEQEAGCQFPYETDIANEFFQHSR